MPSSTPGHDGYRALGLSRNPFVADQSPGVPDDVWIDRGIDPPEPSSKTVVQLVGERGMGKTSLLLRWQSMLGGEYLHIDQGWDRWTSVPIGRIAYWDEADRLPGVVLGRALRAAAKIDATIVVGTHRSLAKWARRTRMAVTTFDMAAPEPETVVRWAERRIEAALVGGAVQTYWVDIDLATAVTDASGSDWRAIGDRLHAHAAEAARDALT